MDSGYEIQVENRVELNASDVRRAKRVALDSKKLFEKELRNLVLKNLDGKISYEDQQKKQKELLELKTQIESFGSSIQARSNVGANKLSLKDKKEMHHLANSGIYTQDEVADIFITNQAQVSRYANKPSDYFEK